MKRRNDMLTKEEREVYCICPDCGANNIDVRIWEDYLGYTQRVNICNNPIHRIDVGGVW